MKELSGLRGDEDKGWKVSRIKKGERTPGNKGIVGK